MDIQETLFNLMRASNLNFPADATECKTESPPALTDLIVEMHVFTNLSISTDICTLYLLNQRMKNTEIQFQQESSTWCVMESATEGLRCAVATVSLTE